MLVQVFIFDCKGGFAFVWNECEGGLHWECGNAAHLCIGPVARVWGQCGNAAHSCTGVVLGFWVNAAMHCIRALGMQGDLAMVSLLCEGVSQWFC